jgi:CHAD domain-containing protein
MHTTPKMLFIKLNQAASREWLPENIFPPGLQLKTLSSWTERREFYDTFEWQAFEKGFVIVKKKKTLFLTDLKSGRETSSLALPGNPSSFFSETLPSGNLKASLSSCSEIRAFIKLCCIDAIIHSYSILDANEKTIATLKSESLFLLADKEQPEPFIHLLSILPYKGYEDEMRLIEKALSDDVGTVLDFRKLFQLIMNAAGRNIHDYSSKIRLELDADAPVYDSARQLLQFTFSVMRANEAGIIKNIDSEFLHDYRVAIRRTRSILKQLKGVFDPEETAYYLNCFRDLGKRTNELRDMDVYLLKQTTYFHYLPPTLQPSLKLFFNDIASSRRRLHKQLCSYLQSTAYQSFLEEWETFANRLLIPDPELSPNATFSTKSVAVECIKKAWKKVVRHGRQISRETTDTELHALRIDCKKLRYLLEFFSSIFPQKTILPVIRQLKELQDNLGDFVDFSVQHHFLQDRLKSIPPGKEGNMLAASIGGLMATLFQKKEETRSKFHKTFRSFDHEETSQLFHDLLNSPE